MEVSVRRKHPQPMKANSHSLKLGKEKLGRKKMKRVETKQLDFWTDPESAIKNSYRETDNEILGEVVSYKRGGSTAVTAIFIDGEKLVVANVGDSQVVICRKGVSKQLSVDHEPKKERETIEGKGGFVTEAPGNVPCVDGQLAMARAFGDGRLKEHISSEPDVVVKMIDGKTEFMILASDRLWRVGC